MHIPVRLDYQRPSRPFPWAGTLLLIMALTMMALLGSYYYTLNQKAEKLETGVHQMQRASFKKLWPGHRDAQETEMEIQHANELLYQISMPWETLFQAVEDAEGDDVTLLGMEPDTSKRVMKITGEARNFYAMLSYLQRLEDRKEFSSVYLQNHHVQQQDPDKPVRFAVMANWRNIQ